MPIIASILRASVRAPAVLAALVLCALVPDPARAQDHAHQHGQAPKAHGHHPAPREGISGQGVLSGEVVPSSARDAYTIAARIPSILDALYCHCDCHERDELRSLLECFENRMATTCGICQSEARMAGEMHADGKSLEEIRKAIDDRYGD
ncbi:PCYCGC motif-containing (lipo)protein [Longimicrobium sp.]|jgi:hypothetical protein|uniref:PCYCGC motif-containing (lipo)protein n=1 Tax=Longimicrobium sp. TaxID=2029185 RepID=UPI002EDA34AF